MENDWILDSGASEHMSGDRSVFTSLTRHETPISITIASGDSLASTYYGQVNLLNHLGEKVSLAQVLLVEDLTFISSLSPNSPNMGSLSTSPRISVPSLT